MDAPLEAISTELGRNDLPFSQAIRHGDTIYVFGQGPIDPATSDIVGEDVREQTARTLENVGAILEAGGSSLDRVVREGVYLRDMRHYDAVNEVYGEYLSSPIRLGRPSRSTTCPSTSWSRSTSSPPSEPPGHPSVGGTDRR